MKTDTIEKSKPIIRRSTHIRVSMIVMLLTAPAFYAGLATWLTFHSKAPNWVGASSYFLAFIAPILSIIALLVTVGSSPWTISRPRKRLLLLLAVVSLAVSLWSCISVVGSFR